jgi:hypothetical protein
MPPEFRSYRDEHKTIVFFHTPFVTINAIEDWSSDKSQPDSLCITLWSSMTLDFSAPDKLNPNENEPFMPDSFPKFFNSPYFFGLITPHHMLSCSKRLPKNLDTEPNQ